MFCQLCVYAGSNAGYPDVITIVDEAQKYANIKFETGDLMIFFLIN